jgi:hypothetical protein
MNQPEVFLINPSTLVEHPLLESIPVLDEASPEFQSLLASIRDRGVDTPAFLDEFDRIMDGRNRARAAIRAGVELPVIRRSSAEASEIILSALINRRHLPKSALAYLTAPLFKDAVEAGRRRRIAKLVPGSFHRDPTASGHERFPRDYPENGHGAVSKTVEELAAEFGFSADLYEQAVRVRKLFENTKPKTWHDGPREVEFTFKGWFEPKILSGEIGLGGVIQAIAGKEATDGVTPAKRDLPTLFKKGLLDLKNRFERWETLTPETRREVTREVATAAATWPEDVRHELLGALERAAAHPSPRPGY